jgi:hypothetical protein
MSVQNRLQYFQLYHTGLTKLVMESYDFMLNGIKTMNADK